MRSRMAAANAMEAQRVRARGEFESLFNRLGDLTAGAISADSVADAYGHGLGEALRYLAGPPISVHDLQMLADVESVKPAALKKNPDAQRRVVRVIRRMIDPIRFPWLEAGSAPTRQQRETALLASSTLLATERAANVSRMAERKALKTRVKSQLLSLGFTEAPPTMISAVGEGPQAGQFCADCQLGERGADVVVRLHDTRLMAIECKVSNGSTSSAGHLNNNAVVKAEQWIRRFGAAQIVPAAVLAGAFRTLNLEQAQARGLALFWSHGLDELGAFIESAR